MDSLNTASAALDHFTRNESNTSTISKTSFAYKHQLSRIRPCSAAAVRRGRRSSPDKKRSIRCAHPGNGRRLSSRVRSMERRTWQTTILLYAHYDVQPVGREELWTTPPFEPSERNGRLYGRGTSDDKGGVVMYSAAITSYLASIKRLPVNVKVLIEGEEEVGSTNLNKLLDQHRALLSADVVVIATARISTAASRRSPRRSGAS